jgi:hypothetical protein
MVLETKAGLEAGVVGAGHRFAAKRLDAQRSTAGWVGEQMGGLAYLEHIRALAKRVEADWEGVQARPRGGPPPRHSAARARARAQPPQRPPDRASTQALPSGAPEARRPVALPARGRS